MEIKKKFSLHREQGSLCKLVYDFSRSQILRKDLSKVQVITPFFSISRHSWVGKTLPGISPSWIVSVHTLVTSHTPSHFCTLGGPWGLLSLFLCQIMFPGLALWPHSSIGLSSIP